MARFVRKNYRLSHYKNNKEEGTNYGSSPSQQQH